MRFSILLLTFAGCSHGSAPAPTTGSAADNVTGTWHGSSRCLVTPSACHNEEVVYHFAPIAGGWSVNANKIVDGKEEPMGELTCTSTGPDAIRCPVEGKGAFAFQIAGDHMNGELVLTDGTKFRTIAAQRVR
jgi:hypothetical protein